MVNQAVIFEELGSASQHKIGVATLNSPKTLNGLSLEMCQLLDARLQQWQADENIAVIVLRGAEEKAFCAGGDLHSLYKSMLQSDASDAWSNQYARDFFETEYRLDYRIHTYTKPIICWGSGIVMGGGVGLMMGASHRVVTETTQLAMPEITIGLYPDVAGTWMLSRLPKGIGEFLAFTGSKLVAADCLHYGLADRYCESTSYNNLLKTLSSIEWAADNTDHHAQVDWALDQNIANSAALAMGPLQKHADLIRCLCNRSEFSQICNTIASFKSNPDPFLARAALNFSSGAAGSARLSYTLIKLAHKSSLADTFRREFIASLHCCAEPDFREGIRALLVDKDRSPNWNPSHLEEASEQWVSRFLQAPWPAGQEHPLADLI